jgi:hypothetical protein
MASWKIAVRGPIWKYPGPGGWYFVSVGMEASKKLKAEKRVNRTGYGYVPVMARLGSSAWETTLFPSKDGAYLLAIKASVRGRERVGVGDEVEAECVVEVSDPRPDDFA